MRRLFTGPLEGGLILAGVAGLAWCWGTHTCMCGHLAHGQPRSLFYIDLLWFGCLLAWFCLRTRRHLRGGFSSGHLLELLLTLLILGVSMPLPPSGRGLVQRAEALRHMKQLGWALRLYEDREGQFPPYDGDAFLAALYDSGACSDLGAFHPRQSPTPPAAALAALKRGCLPELAAVRNADGFLDLKAMSDDKDVPTCAIACDTLPDGSGPHGGGETRVVLYLDGSARTMQYLTIGSDNGDPGGPKDLSRLVMD